MTTNNEDIKLADFTFTKHTDAMQFHGRGSDNVRVPAKWAINYQDKQVGLIYCRSMRQFDVPDWSVVRFTADGVKELRCMLKSRAAAVAWVQANAEKFIN